MSCLLVELKAKALSTCQHRAKSEETLDLASPKHRFKSLPSRLCDKSLQKNKSRIGRYQKPSSLKKNMKQ